MTRKTRRYGTLAALTLIACFGSDAPTGPDGSEPGTLTISLTRAIDPEAGLLIELTGDASTFTAAGPSTFWVRSEGTSHRLIVRGPLSVGPIVRFVTPDQNGSYDIRIIQAAAGATWAYQRLAPDDFEVGISR